MTEPVPGAAGRADDERAGLAAGVDDCGRLARASAGRLEGHHARRRRPRERPERGVSRYPASPDHHALIADRRGEAAVATERADVHEAGLWRPREAVPVAIGRRHLTDDKSVAD